MMKPDIIDTRDLFPELYSELIGLLRNLTPEEWNYKTSSTLWNVKDIVAHLVDTDFRRISFQRDNMAPPSPAKPVENYNQLVDYLNYLNKSWIDASKRLSPKVLIDFLSYVSIEIPKLYDSLDMNDEALFSVSWAGEEQSANWFDIAREYTEKWYHQQQIREAVGRPLLTERKWIYPLIDTFIRGLANTYQNIFQDKTDSTVLIEISDIEDANWILKKSIAWELFVGHTSGYTSKVILTADTAWRMFSKSISKDEAKGRITVEGDYELGSAIVELTTFMK